MDTNILVELYRTTVGCEPEQMVAINSAGSNRRYFRLSGGGRSLVGVLGNVKEENDAFVFLSGHFAEKGIPVPRVVAVSRDGMAYLQTDLGDVSLYDVIKANDDTKVVNALLDRIVCLLADAQFKGADGLDFSRCYPRAAMDRRSVMWDLNYFKYCFLKAAAMEFSEERLENDFERLTDVLLADEFTAFQCRDFQSRNVMIYGDEPYLIDYQGGRRGPVYYDVASFLWQARAGFSRSQRESLIDCYLRAARKYKTFDRVEFRKRLRYFVLFRTLQVLGAYGFRGFFERKAQFVVSVPAAIQNLNELLNDGFPEFPYLSEILGGLAQLPRFKTEPAGDGLVVSVMSFSYKKGIPDDISGNGGGYVFDCRAVHNPGRYDDYKSLTGMDAPVIDFLERDGGISKFLDSCYMLVDDSVATYMRRGFSRLMVCFGCTGGQHRSVYSAQKMAEHISDKFGVRVELMHRERGVTKTFLPK